MTNVKVYLDLSFSLIIQNYFLHIPFMNSMPVKKKNPVFMHM